MKTTSEFTNELGNAICITIEGPTSKHENTITPMEFAKLQEAISEHSAAYLGPQAATTEEAAREVGKWLNERPNRPIDLRHVAMLVAHAQSPDSGAGPADTQLLNWLEKSDWYIGPEPEVDECGAAVVWDNKNTTGDLRAALAQQGAQNG